MALPPAQPHERIIWEGYPSWLEHTILFIFMGAGALRALLALRTAQWTVAILYAASMAVFFAIAAAFHYGAYYRITSHSVRILNGWSKRCSRDIRIEQVRAVDVRSELLNRWLGIGGLILTCADPAEETVVLKGLPDPDRIKRHLEALVTRHADRTADSPSPD